MYKYHMLLWSKMDSKFSNRIRQRLKSNFTHYLNVWWILKPVLLKQHIVYSYQQSFQDVAELLY